MATIDLNQLFDECRRKERYPTMYRQETCPKCGAPVTSFDSVDFESTDTVTQRFRCGHGHEFYAVFSLVDVLANPAAEPKDIE